MESGQLREILSINIKKERKKLGFTQERLAEAANLSAQTINDIEGCRMWVSDKTITKLALVLHVEVYQLFIPEQSLAAPPTEAMHYNDLLGCLENNLIKTIRCQFREALDLSRDKSPQ